MERAEGERLADLRIAIIGLGLMGGSLALALKGKCRQLLGFDADGSTRARAASMAVVDLVSADIREVMRLADLIALAAPVGAILDLLRRLPEIHAGRAVVLDLGSSKVEITQAMAQLPERYDPLGGHPMCGKERLGLANAEASLFQGATFALTPLQRTSPKARALAEQLARAVGAAPLWIDAQAHDRLVAATSHLPYLLSAALARLTPLEARPLVGPGFRSATRLAATPHSMMLDALRTNRHNLLEGLETMRRELELARELLADGSGPALQAYLEAAAARREALAAQPGEGGR
ncbi:MAG: prephenate dehydrogenase [Anaerolineales bacterium]|nr:prephenate dehydrogenase [Anaerolineales bacterium]